MQAPLSFIRALQNEMVPCGTPDCPGPVAASERSQADDRVKVFDVHCERCGWSERVAGQEDQGPPWDESSLTAIIDEHLLHLQPICPFDHAPVFFHSLPSPRRKARYRITCYFCGRQAELDWPPQESKW